MLQLKTSWMSVLCFNRPYDRFPTASVDMTVPDNQHLGLCPLFEQRDKKFLVISWCFLRTMCPLLQCKSTFLYVGCLVMVVYFFFICSVVENEIMFAIRSKCYNQLKLNIYIYIYSITQLKSLVGVFMKLIYAGLYRLNK